MTLKKNWLLLSALFVGQLIFAQAGAKKDFHSWAPTPPMGWNSWDCYGPNVTESEVKANADYMAKNLKQFGWNYVVVDIRWYVANDKSHGYNEKDPQFSIDSFGRFIPAVNRFPSSAGGKGFKPLADYLHAKGLKLGIHIMRGVPVIAVKNKMPIYGTDLTAADIFSDSIQCKWLHDMYTVLAKKGAQEYYNSIVNLYASWGVDFIKCDDLSRPYHKAEINMLRKAIDNCGRKILLSTSPGETPIAEGKHVQANANMWRTIDDFWDNWPELKAHFDIFARWNQYRAAGAYPDGDMLPLGHLGIKAERGVDRMSLFTKDEHYTVMTLWCMFRSPLMFGGDLPGNDAFTLSLLTNKELLYILNHSTDNRQVFNADNKISWTADDPATGDKYIALFNAADAEQTIDVSVLKELGVKGSYTLKDLWTGKINKQTSPMISVVVNPHGTVLYKLSRKK